MGEPPLAGRSRSEEGHFRSLPDYDLVTLAEATCGTSLEDRSMKLSLLVTREVNRRDLWPKVVARRAGLLRLRDRNLGVVEASVRAAFEFAHWRNSFYTDAPDWSDECEPPAALAWDGENNVDRWTRIGHEARVRIVEHVIATLGINVGDVTPDVREAAREHLQSGVQAYLDSPDYLELRDHGLG